MYQRIAFIIVVVSGAAILAYCAADDTFLSFAQKHWRNDMKCGKGGTISGYYAPYSL